MTFTYISVKYTLFSVKKYSFFDRGWLFLFSADFKVKYSSEIQFLNFNKVQSR